MSGSQMGKLRPGVMLYNSEPLVDRSCLGWGGGDDVFEISLTLWGKYLDVRGMDEVRVRVFPRLVCSKPGQQIFVAFPQLLDSGDIRTGVCV